MSTSTVDRSKQTMPLAELTFALADFFEKYGLAKWNPARLNDFVSAWFYCERCSCVFTLREPIVIIGAAPPCDLKRSFELEFSHPYCVGGDCCLEVGSKELDKILEAYIAQKISAEENLKKKLQSPPAARMAG